MFPGRWLHSAIGQVCGWTLQPLLAGWGLRMYSATGSCPWLDSAAACVLWPGFLVGWNWICFPVQAGHRGFMNDMAHWLGTYIRQNYLLSFLCRHTYQLGSSDVQSHWLGFLLWCHQKQEHYLPQFECWLLLSFADALPPFSVSIWSSVAEPCRFPRYPCEVKPK